MEIKVVDVQSHVFPKDYAELLCKSKSKVGAQRLQKINTQSIILMECIRST